MLLMFRDMLDYFKGDFGGCYLWVILSGVSNSLSSLILINGIDNLSALSYYRTFQAISRDFPPFSTLRLI